MRAIPIRDLRNTVQLSEMVHNLHAPLCITKNGYDDMVIMSSEEYEKIMARLNVYAMIAEGEAAIARGEKRDVFEALDE
jgi:prevent-host-death family protein